MNKQPEAKPRTIAYRADIDGLRAVAILSVVAYHYLDSFGGHVSGGYVGVDVFFVISGYLITGIIMRELHGARFSLLEFYASRIRRILPPVLIVIVACLAVGWLWLMPNDLRPLARNAAAGAFFLSNFLSWRESSYFGLAAESKPFLHLWSLAIEEQFYLLWPVLLLAASKLRRGMGLGIASVVLSSFLVNLELTNHSHTAAFYLPISRVWELAVGGLLAWRESHSGSRGIMAWRLARSRQLARVKDWQSILGILVIIICVLAMMRTPAFPGYLAIAPVLGAALILAAGPGAIVNATILSCRPAIFLGRISYSLYLWHWPVLVFASLLFQTKGSIRITGVCLVLAALLAIATYYLVERPIRRIRIDRESSVDLIKVGVTSSLLVAVISYQISAGTIVRSWDAGLITRKDSEVFAGCMAMANNNQPANIAIFAPCERLKYPGRPIVFLVGDSFSVALYQGLQPYLDQHRINLIDYSVVYCTPLSLKDKRSECVDYNRYIHDRIASQKPQMVVISAHHLLWTQDPNYNESHNYETYIREKAESLMNAGVPHVVLVGQVPTWRATLPELLNLEYLRYNRPVPERMLTGLAQESLQVDSDMKTQSQGSEVTYYSVRNALCNAQGCLTKVGVHFPEQLIVFDYGHLTGAGASFVVEGGLGSTIMAELDAKGTSPE
jgi:peptidoglycan/LPS O-acetylase OafA/YrhL